MTPVCVLVCTRYKQGEYKNLCLQAAKAVTWQFELQQS